MQANKLNSVLVGTVGAVLSFGLGSCAEPEPRLIPEACEIGGEQPHSAAELLARPDALPRPVTIPCLVASLPRPLSVVATDSDFSVQPAVGRESPRVFIMDEGLVLSSAMAGEGRELLEFGEWRSGSQTLKGELEFPLSQELELADMYVRTEAVSTRCAACHRNEEPSQELPGYFSDAIRPVPESIVSLEELVAARESCDWNADAARCEMLAALLDFGTVEEGSFASSLPTFY